MAENYYRYLRKGIYNSKGKPDHPLTDDQMKWYKDAKGNPILYNAQPFTEEELIKDVFQLYNKGAYWRWKPDDAENPMGPGSWLKSPPENNTYGDKAWNLYNNVKNGSYPDGWNNDYTCNN